MRLIQSLCILLLIASPRTGLPDNDFIVAVTIKPIHSLVAGVMKDAGEPRLIMRSNTSPHHYTLRPSERRALARAALVFWVGPNLESFMPRILSSLDDSTENIALIDASGLLRLPARTVHHHAPAQSHVDPHIWLSATNAHAMVDAIADALINRDPVNAGLYEANRKRMLRRISETDQHIRGLLSQKTSPFLSYHDAYQYFEHDYALTSAGSVSSGDELSPSARQVQELREKIREQQLHCLFYEAPNRPALVDALVQDLPVNVHELDVMGVRVEAGEDAWFEIMTALANAGAACL